MALAGFFGGAEHWACGWAVARRADWGCAVTRDDRNGFLAGIGVGLTIATLVVWVVWKIGGVR